MTFKRDVNRILVFRIVIFVSLVCILVIHSSKITFMPNFFFETGLICGTYFFRQCSFIHFSNPIAVANY